MEAFLEKSRGILNSFSVSAIPNIDFLAHFHISIEFIYVTGGRLLTGVNGYGHTVEEGDLFICGSNEIHYYEKNTAAGIMVIFHPGLIDMPAGWPDTGSIGHIHIKEKYLSDEIKFLLNLLTDYNKLYTHFETGAEYLIIKGIIMTIFGFIKRLGLHSENDAIIKSKLIIRQRLQKSIKYIEDNFKETLTASEIAEYINISESSLSHMFKKNIGITIPHYINIVRIHNVEKEMNTTDKTLTEIALDNGFGTVRSFNRVFKSHYGHAPSFIKNKDSQ